MAKAAAKSTQFLIGTVPVGGITSIGGVATSADTIDVTALDSPGNYREFIGGFKDGGEVSLSGFFDFGNEGQTALYEAYESGETIACVIKFPTSINASWTFSGVVTAIETGAELEDAVTFDATVKVSGKPTLAATTGG